MSSGPVGQVADLFAEWFTAAPSGVWQAPGRVNLIGEHTDYNGGLVLPFAIGRTVRVAAAESKDNLLRMRSRQGGGQTVSVSLDRLAPGAVDGWAAYLAGIAWVLRQDRHELGGACLAVDSDLPIGAGLSSSAALECAAALALTGLNGIELPAMQLAALARHAENDFVGVPSGIMDQAVAMLGKRNNALLLDCRTWSTELVPLDLTSAGAAVIVADTRQRHTLTDGRYADRHRECERAARALGVASLRDLDVAVTGDETKRRDYREVLERLADPVLARRVRHVLSENRRVRRAAALLRAGEVAACGELLTASHMSLRDDFEVSWEQADVAVEAAHAAGALGARMTGGGFGGSVVALIPVRLRTQVRAAISAAYAARNWASPRFLDVAPADGARRVR